MCGGQPLREKLRMARAADNRTHAKELIKEMLFELHDEGDAALDPADSNFNDLSDYYENTI
jgi:hypothetical protein